MRSAAPPPPMSTAEALAAFSALGQDTRLAVLRMLIVAGPEGLPAGHIANHLNVLQNTMSNALSVLHQAGLVTRHRKGRQILYAADVGGVGRLISYLLEDCCGGRPETCAALFDQLTCRAT